MSILADIQKLNRDLAEQVNQEARINPDSPYSGKFVGIANGRVVAVSADEAEVDLALDKIESDPKRVFIVDTTLDPNHVEYIWEIR
jgi:hypothetical protein